MSILFQTEDCAIRHCVNSDSVSSECVSSILTSKVTAHLPLDWQDISTSAQAAKWVCNRLKDGGFYTIEDTTTRDIIGFLFLNECRSNKDINELRLGYLLAETYWGRGIAGQIIRSLVEYYCKYSSVNRIVGGIALENTPSKKVLLKAGFQLHHCIDNTEYYEYRFQR